MKPEPSLKAERAVDTLVDIKHLLVESLDRETEGITYRLDTLSFHLGGITWTFALFSLWGIENVTGFFSTIWKIIW